MHFITNSYKRFLLTNSPDPDPRHSVPLSTTPPPNKHTGNNVIFTNENKKNNNSLQGGKANFVTVVVVK